MLGINFMNREKQLDLPYDNEKWEDLEKEYLRKIIIEIAKRKSGEKFDLISVFGIRDKYLKARRKIIYDLAQQEENNLPNNKDILAEYKKIYSWTAEIMKDCNIGYAYKVLENEMKSVDNKINEIERRFAGAGIGIERSHPDNNN